MASEQQKHERYDFDFYFFGSEEEQVNYSAYTLQPTCCGRSLPALRAYRIFCFIIMLAIVVLQFIHYSWFYVALLDCWSNISLCFALLLLSCNQPSKGPLKNNVWRGALICHHFAWSGAWVAFIYFWIYFSRQQAYELDKYEILEIVSNNVSILFLLIELFSTRLRFLHRMILFVVVLYLLFILINYIATKVANQHYYQPITYQTWTTLGFFVLYIVLIIVFFYLGYLLGEWKFCILKGGSAINAGDWSITESFSDTYNTDRRSSRDHSLVSRKINSSRNSVQTEYGRVGKKELEEPSSPRFQNQNPPTPKRRGDSALFDKEMLRQLNKAISKNSTPLSSFDVQDPRRQSGGL